MPGNAEQVFDLVVVGGGPGGYPAAIRAAQLGLKTALVDKERPGGVCLNWGCIPTKAMLRSAEVLETVQHGAEYGVLADNVRLDYSAVLKRKDRVTKTLTDGVASLLKANGVTVLNGHARFVGPTAVEVVAVGEAPLGPGGRCTTRRPRPTAAPRPGWRDETCSWPPARPRCCCPSPGSTCPGWSPPTAPSCWGRSPGGS